MSLTSVTQCALKSLLNEAFVNFRLADKRKVSSLLDSRETIAKKIVNFYKNLPNLIIPNIIRNATIDIVRPKFYGYREEYAQGLMNTSRFVTKPKMSAKFLVAFDFDNTLIDVNSDTHILQLLPDKGKSVKQFSNLQWIEYMQKVFDALKKANICANDIYACLDTIKITNGMQELLTDLREKGHDSIIVSDSNNVFIHHVLEKHNLENCFEQVFTNPAYFDSEDHLHISVYHEQNWCELSAVNLCKGQILEDFVKAKNLQGVNYHSIGYVGDGYNDFCPMVRLSSNDYAFPRSGYPCHKAILKEDRLQYKLKAKMIPWETGFEIRDVLLE